MFRIKCLICKSQELVSVIDLGMHPFADTFINKERVGDSEPVYPLICNLCNKCGHVQLKYITDPNDRYSKYDYSYTSSNSSFSRMHWDKFCNEVSSNIELSKDALVVDVGSNDGFLGSKFIERGNKFIGIDASPYMARLAEKRSVTTIVGLLNTEIVNKVNSDFGHAKLVISNNVFNHADFPVEFIQYVSLLLSTDGIFVFEVPYWFIEFEEGNFDKIYHEHINYFTIKSLKKILELSGMVISSVEVIDYHGGSLRVYAKKNNSGSFDNSNNIKNMIDKETASGVFNSKSYITFMNNISKNRNLFLKKIYSIKTKGLPLVAVGAAAKGNTFLNYYNLDHTVIDYVTDVSKYKIGKYTALTRIPIVSDDIFSKYDEVYALVLTGNISGNLKKILHQINPRIKFISP